MTLSNAIILIGSAAVWFNGFFPEFHDRGNLHVTTRATPERNFFQAGGYDTTGWSRFNEVMDMRTTPALGVKEGRVCMNSQDASGSTQARLLPAAVAGWFAYLVFDFLVHAVFLAQWWRATESYWLPSLELFRRIPFGYASFAIHCAVLAWLLRRLYGDRLNLTRGLRFGAIAGLVFGLAFVFGTYSAFRMPPSALVVWPASIFLDSVIASGVISWVLVADRPWRRVGMVILAAVLLFILGAIIQNVFFPTPADHIFR